MISIVIPTYNEENNLSRLIESIKKNKNSKYEIIVVDNGSTDRTKEIAEKEGCIFLFNQKKTKVGLSRNMGAEKAKSDLVYFIDADWKLLGKNHLEKIIKFFEDHPDKQCGEPIVKYKKDTFVKKLIAIENESRIRKAKMGAYIYRKDFFTEIGGFGNSLGFGEDKILTEKVYKYSGRIKEAKLLQDLVKNIKSIFKQGKWYGKGFINYFKESKEIKPFISVIFWTAWIFLIPLSFVLNLFAYLLILNLLGMFFISAVYLIRSKKIISLLMPIIKITRSIGEIFGIISYSLKKILNK